MSFKHNSKNLFVLPILGAMVLQGCTDGSSDSGAAIVPSNLPPIITSDRAVAIDEGSDGTIYVATATDADGDPVTYSIANFDAADFTIDSQTGEVAFFSEPDFEAPEDTDFDNVYSFILTATDSKGGGKSSAHRRDGRRYCRFRSALPREDIHRNRCATRYRIRARPFRGHFYAG